MLDIKLFNYEAKFCLGVANLKQIPIIDIPQVAFWGRSNVGKSSLLNALFNKKKLVRVSNTPGRTRELNFFSILDSLYFVDLPGYGYAKFDKNLKEKWTDLTVSYIDEVINLKQVYILIDSKIGFLNIDIEALEFLETIAKPYQIILTKIDKISKQGLLDVLKLMQEYVDKSSCANKKVIAVSSKHKTDLEDIKYSILEVVNNYKKSGVFINKETQ